MKKVLNFSFFLFAFTLFLSCSNAPEGEKVAAGEAQETAEADAKSETAYTVDAGQSVIYWTGTKPGGAHTGTVNLSSGTLGATDGNITSGSFVIDMTSIKNTDLDAETAPKLEGHLKTGDFFEVDAHPTGKFEKSVFTGGVTVPGAL